MAHVKIVYYLDVLSSWCLVAEAAVTRLREEFGDRVDVDWRIAALREELNYTPEMLAWFYRRTDSMTGVRLNPAWLTTANDGSKWANFAAEAARGLGCTDDRVRLAIARGTMLEGKPSSQRSVAVDIAAKAGGLDRTTLDRAIDDPATAERIRATSTEFASFNVDLRPTFVLRNGTGDITVLSGSWKYDPLAVCVHALLDDQSSSDAFTSKNQAPAGVT
jgi:predicted DsbA family dithiol-disulfide isomerase